jgi:hypothetical protein
MIDNGSSPNISAKPATLTRQTDLGLRDKGKLAPG